MDATATAELDPELCGGRAVRRDQPQDNILGRRLDLRDGPTRVGRYALLRELGRGAIGVVYAAYHEGLDRKLAIKLLNPLRAGRADLEARLHREARALAKLSHPNVVQVYDVGEYQGRVFVAMEFVEGQTLADWMRGEHELDAVIAMFCDAGRGLAAAHQAGVIHRDFKPDNVLVGDDGRPRVLDFGLACPIEPIAIAELDHARLDPDGEPANFGTSLDQLLRTGELGDEPRPRARARPRQDPGQEGPGSGRDRLPRQDPDATQDNYTPQFAGDDPERSQDAIATQTNVAPAQMPAQPPPSASSEFDDTLIYARTRPRETDDLDVVTRTGALMGTPAYMSPEQFCGGQIDHASDQFSFCVALHEALYGHRPFVGRSALELGVATAAGEVIDAPPNTRVPAWLRALLLRGLSPAPKDRFASMDELIAALEHQREAPKRRWLIGVAVAGLSALAVTAGVLANERPSPCPTVEDSAAQLWTPARGVELHEVFARSQLAYAKATWASVEPRLQTWARAWATQHVDACEATNLNHELSPEVLALREACLARASRSYEVLLDRLEAGAPRAIEHAVEATAALPDPGQCGDIDALLSAAGAGGPGSDAVQLVRLRLAELDTLIQLGDWEPSLPLAQATLERARASEYGPLIAEATFAYGRLLARTGAREQALEHLQDALDEAERSDDDVLVPGIAVELAQVSLELEGEHLRAQVWARRAMMGLDRLDKRDLARVRALWMLGKIELLEHHGQAAGAHLTQALFLLDELAPDHPDKPALLHDLAGQLEAEGQLADARERYTQAIVASSNMFGASHPRVGDTHRELARFELERGLPDAAREQLELALRVYVESLGPDTREVGRVEVLRARLEIDAGRLDEAEAHATHAVDIDTRERGSSTLERAEPYSLLGRIAFTRGRFDAAIGQYRSSLAVQEFALPPGHPALAGTLTALGRTYLANGQPDLAVEQFERSVETLVAGAVDTDDQPALRLARIDLGEALLARAGPDDARRAAVSFEAAFTGCERGTTVCTDAALGAAKASAARGDDAAAKRWNELAARRGGG